MFHRPLAGLLALALFPLTADAQTLVNGGHVSGVIAAPGQVDVWTFTANAGEGFQLSMVDLGGGAFWPGFEVFEPGGASLVSANWQEVIGVEQVAPASGTYTVHAFDASGSGLTAAYELHLVRAPGADELGALPNGGSVTSSLTKGDLDSYTFHANAGDAIHLRASDQSGSALEIGLNLFYPDGAPHGSYAYGPVVGSLELQAPQTGTYTVVLYDDSGPADQTGTYRVDLVRAPGADEHGLLQEGDLLAGLLGLGDLDSFTFLASPGQTADLLLTDTSGTPLYPFARVYGPTGIQIAAGGSGTSTTVSAPITTYGLHTVVLFDASGLAQVGRYTVALSGSGLHPSQVANVSLDAELPGDPVLDDVGGDPLLGPRVGDPSEPFNLALDCSGAAAPGAFLIQTWTGTLAAPLPTVFGWLHVTGVQLGGVVGAHAQDVITWLPTPTGLTLPGDPSLVGLELCSQGWVGGQGPSGGRTSNALVQTIAF